MGPQAEDAATIVEWVLGVVARPATRPGPAVHHDFDLVGAGIPTGALAVAVSARPPHPQSWRTVQRAVWEGRGLDRSWVVRLEHGGCGATAERMIVALVGELEREGGGGFRRADQVRIAALRAAGLRLSAAERVLEDLAAFGVVGAEPRTPTCHPPVVVAKVPAPASTSPEAVNEAVEDEAWGAENRSRLAAAGMEDRHLFVWLDPAHTVARDAMGPDDVPAPPLLAPETTTLWVARGGAPGGALLADRLWQTDASGAWEALSPVTRRPRLAGAPL